LADVGLALNPALQRVLHDYIEGIAPAVAGGQCRRDGWRIALGSAFWNQAGVRSWRLADVRLSRKAELGPIHFELDKH
jgi:hypothetical protein